MKGTLHKGTVSVEHTVWCVTSQNVGETRLPYDSSECHHFVQESGPSRVAIAEARRQGWRHTVELGWMCFNCYHAYRRFLAGT